MSQPGIFEIEDAQILFGATVYIGEYKFFIPMSLELIRDAQFDPLEFMRTQLPGLREMIAERKARP